MRYSLFVDVAAQFEAADIYLWRERDRPGSGERFVEALINTYKLIRENPFRHRLRKGDFRHAMVGRMKFRVVYHIEGHDLHVVQVRHTSRKPSKRFGP